MGARSVAQKLRAWRHGARVRAADRRSQLGYVLHVLPSGVALVEWDGMRERRYVALRELEALR